MKKIIISVALGVSLLAAQAQSDSKIYTGLDIVAGINNFDNDMGGAVDKSNNSYGAKLKVGYIFAQDWRVQGYYQYESYSSTVYPDKSNDVLNELGVDLIREFDISSKFTPFAQVGLGYGLLDLSDNTLSSAEAGSIKIGGGAMYKITPKIEALAGLDIQYRDWTDTNVGFSDYDISEISTKLYIGMNYHF